MSEKNMAKLWNRSMFDMRNPPMKRCDHCFVIKKSKVSFKIHSPRRP